MQSRGQFYANVQYNEVPERLIPQDDKECAVLPRCLKLAVGARVMLQRNINCGDGFVNGARGQIVGFKKDVQVIQVRGAAAPILFSFQLPVCNARYIYIYIYNM